VVKNCREKLFGRSALNDDIVWRASVRSNLALLAIKIAYSQFFVQSLEQLPRLILMAESLSFYGGIDAATVRQTSGGRVTVGQMSVRQVAVCPTTTYR
jgi:hypothetical protein